MYDIGQIVYVLNTSWGDVIACKVVEERVKRNADGQTSTWIVKRMTGSGARVEFDLKESHEVFTNDKHLRKVLIKRASDGINTMIDHVVSQVVPNEGTDVSREITSGIVE